MFGKIQKKEKLRVLGHPVFTIGELTIKCFYFLLFYINLKDISATFWRYK